MRWGDNTAHIRLVFESSSSRGVTVTLADACLPGVIPKG